MCVHIDFSSVRVAEWPPFGKKLLFRLTICSLCILTIFIFFRFCFEGSVDLISDASVSGLCMFFFLFPPGPTQIRLYSHRILLESGNFFHMNVFFALKDLNLDSYLFYLRRS